MISIFTNALDMLAIEALMIASGIVGYLMSKFMNSSVLTSLQNDINALKAKVSPVTPATTVAQ